MKIRPRNNILCLLKNLQPNMHVTWAKKNTELFLRPYFLKTDVTGRFLFLFRQKTDAGTLFLNS